jgi:hypothetical protein
VFALALLLAGVCALIALTDNNEINNQVAAISHEQELRQKVAEANLKNPTIGEDDRARWTQIASGKPAAAAVEDLRDRQASGRDFLYGSVCAVLALFGIGGTGAYLHSLRQRTPEWTGNGRAASLFALVGAVAPGFVGIHAGLVARPDPGTVVGFVVALAGLIPVFGIVGYHVGRRKEATGLLAIWAGFEAAVAVCVYAETEDLGRVFSGYGTSRLTAQDYAVAVLVMWLAAGAAVAAAGQLIVRYRRKKRPIRPSVTSSRS